MQASFAIFLPIALLLLLNFSFGSSEGTAAVPGTGDWVDKRQDEQTNDGFTDEEKRAMSMLRLGKQPMSILRLGKRTKRGLRFELRGMFNDPFEGYMRDLEIRPRLGDRPISTLRLEKRPMSMLRLESTTKRPPLGERPLSKLREAVQLLRNRKRPTSTPRPHRLPWAYRRWSSALHMLRAGKRSVDASESSEQAAEE